MTATYTIETRSREEMVDITSVVQQAVDESDLESGFVVCFVPHTTAAVTINENADPAVSRDIIYKLKKEFPQDDAYHHAEGNSDAHVKATLVGASEQVLVEEGRLMLGTWQALYFCEFDGPRRRRLLVRTVSIG